MELYLIRHPPVALAPGLCYGGSDVPLAQPPHEAAQRLGALLPADCRVVSSPLQRCRALAECLSSTTHLEPRLAEMSFGDWEKQSFDAIPRTLLDAWAQDPLGFRPPGGECARDMATRTWAALDDWTGDPGPLAFVTHGGPLRAITGRLLGLAEERWLRLEFTFGACSLIRRHESGATLEWVNR